MYACGCRAALHAGCLVSLLEFKFRRCKVCLCSYNAAALHAAARYSLIHPPVLRRMLAFATSAINVGKPEEALSLLNTFPFESLPEVEKCQYLFERGRALALLGRHPQAEQNFARSLRITQLLPRTNPQHQALILVGLAAALIDQKKLYAAAHHLYTAVQMTKVLKGEVAELVMRAIARYFLALGSQARYVSALRTVYAIVRVEEVDPVRKAVVLIEVRLAEAGIGELAVNVDFGHALRTLRASHRHTDMVQGASNVLGRLIKPLKRLRSKIHPEDIIIPQ